MGNPFVLDSVWVLGAAAIREPVDYIAHRLIAKAGRIAIHAFSKGLPFRLESFGANFLRYDGRRGAKIAT